MHAVAKSPKLSASLQTGIGSNLEFGRRGTSPLSRARSHPPGNILKSALAQRSHPESNELHSKERSSATILKSSTTIWAYLSTHTHVHVHIDDISICLSIYLSIYLSNHLSIHLSSYIYIHMYSCLYVCFVSKLLLDCMYVYAIHV